MKNPQAKVGRVMREFKSGKLKSSSGQKVTNPKQAIAIGLSEAGISKKAKGGDMKESKAMVKKEVSFMKKKGAPKSMIKHEMKEAGMKKGGVAKYAEGGMTKKEFDLIKKIYERSGANVGPRQPMSEDMKRRINAEMDKMGIGGKKTSGGGSGGSSSDTREMQLGSELDPKAMMKREGMKRGGKVKKMAGGGLAAGHKSADGVARKGKTKAEQIKMAGGGRTKKYC